MEPSEGRFYNTPGCRSDWLSWITSYLGFFFSSWPHIPSLLPTTPPSHPFFSSIPFHNFYPDSPFLPLHLISDLLLRWRVCSAVCQRCWTSRGFSYRRWKRGSPPPPTSAPLKRPHSSRLDTQILTCLIIDLRAKDSVQFHREYVNRATFRGF